MPAVSLALGSHYLPGSPGMKALLGAGVLGSSNTLAALNRLPAFARYLATNPGPMSQRAAVGLLGSLPTLEQQEPQQ
jgi:hypothetical protein